MAIEVEVEDKPVTGAGDPPRTIVPPVFYRDDEPPRTIVPPVFYRDDEPPRTIVPPVFYRDDEPPEPPDDDPHWREFPLFDSMRGSHWLVVGIVAALLFAVAAHLLLLLAIQP